MCNSAVEQLKRLLGSRTLVVIIENLNDVFRRIKPEGQGALRSLVQEWDQIVLVAATPSLFDGVSEHVEPFYGFFEINHLEELTLDEGAQLLAKVADLRGDAETRHAVDLGAELSPEFQPNVLPTMATKLTISPGKPPRLCVSARVRP